MFVYVYDARTALRNALSISSPLRLLLCIHIPFMNFFCMFTYAQYVNFTGKVFTKNSQHINTVVILIYVVEGTCAYYTVFVGKVLLLVSTCTC